MNESRLLKPLPWFVETWARLADRLQRNTMAHGLLVIGPRGIGKRRLVSVLIQAIQCPHAEGGVVACGVCDPCQWVATETHPDVHYLAPEEEGKAIGVDAVREFIEFFSLTSRMGKKKIGVIDRADRMTESAANSLLKTLEEPAGNSMIVLLSDAPAKLLATVKSRCQQIVCPPISLANASVWLQATGHGEAVAMLPMCDNAPLEAIRLAESGAKELRETWLRDFVAVAEKRGDPVATAERWYKEDLPRLLQWLATCYTDMAALSFGLDPKCALNQDFLESLTRLAQRVEQKQLFLRLDELNRIRKTLSHPLNKQLVIESLLLSWVA